MSDWFDTLRAIKNVPVQGYLGGTGPKEIVVKELRDDFVKLTFDKVEIETHISNLAIQPQRKP